MVQIIIINVSNDTFMRVAMLNKDKIEIIDSNSHEIGICRPPEMSDNAMRD